LIGGYGGRETWRYEPSGKDENEDDGEWKGCRDGSRCKGVREVEGHPREFEGGKDP
jgi:hypothetical protein